MTSDYIKAIRIFVQGNLEFLYLHNGSWYILHGTLYSMPTYISLTDSNSIATVLRDVLMYEEMYWFRA